MALQSPKAQLIDNIINYLRNELVWLKYVNVNLRQLDVYEVKPAVDFPCCLVDLLEVQYDQRQDGQHGNLQLRLTLGFDVVNDTSGLAPDAIREAGLDYFDKENEIYQKMQYYNAGGLVFNDFIRLREATQQRDDAFRVLDNDYKATFHDRSAE